MIKDAFGRDLEHACASKGTFSGRLYDVVTDVFSNRPLDTLECEGSDKLHLKLFVGIALSLQKQLAQRVAAIAHANPTAKLQCCQLMLSRSLTRSTKRFAPKQA